MTKPKRQIPVAGTKPAPQVYFRIDRPEPRVVDDAPNWRDRVREIVTPIWFDYHGTHFFDGDGKMIAQIRGWGGLTSSGLSDEEARQVQEKNAAFIVNAVNEYDALVAENEALRERVADANRGAQVNALVNESLAKKLKLAVEALEIRHQWKARNMGYQYSRFVCTVCGMKSDIDETETLCGVGAQRFLIKQTGEQR